MANDRPVLENLADSLRRTFGEILSAEFLAGRFRLEMGAHAVFIDSTGHIEGESFSGVRSDHVGIDPD